MFKRNKIKETKPKQLCICTKFTFYNEEEKFLAYLGYVKLNKTKYSIYIDRETRELYIYKVKAKRRKNKLYYIEDEEEFHAVEREVLSMLGI